MFRIFAVLKMLQRMKLNVLKRVVLLLMLLAAVPAWAQKLITYEAGMGTRDPSDADVWILYQRVRAVHEGMVLHADSALLNTVLNDFTAFGHIKIEISDTTTIYGDQLYYDGMTRVLDIWDDTVKLIDGKTILKSDHLQYDRYSSTAVYDSWGKTVNEDKCLTSRQGYYNSDTKVFDIYDSVILIDSNMRLETDTLTYNTNTHIARFWSPTHIYTDSATMYSEHGTYNTDLRYAHSMKASEVHNERNHQHQPLCRDQPGEQHHLRHRQRLGALRQSRRGGHAGCAGHDVPACRQHLRRHRLGTQPQLGASLQACEGLQGRRAGHVRLDVLFRRRLGDADVSGACGLV